MSDHTVFLPTYKGCFICGEPDHNPNTLNVRFRVTDEGVEVPVTTTYRQAGYEGIVHGGVITALLDETIGWAVAVETKRYFMTGELNVRFVRPLPVDLDITVRGRFTEAKSRYATGEGEIVDGEGTVYAKASGKFFPMPAERAEAVKEYLTFRDGDLDILL